MDTFSSINRTELNKQPYQSRDEIKNSLQYTYDETQEELLEKKVGRSTRFYTVNPVKVMYGDDEYDVIYYKQKTCKAVVIESINGITIDHTQYNKKNILETACRLEVAKFIIGIEHQEQKNKIKEQAAIIEMMRRYVQTIKGAESLLEGINK